MRRFRQKNIIQIIVGTLFLPMMYFSFFSAGTMPIFSIHGIEIIICHGNTVQTITVDKNGKPLEKEEIHSKCEWSLYINDDVVTQANITTFLITELGDINLPTHGQSPLLLQAFHNNHLARAPPEV